MFVVVLSMPGSLRLRLFTENSCWGLRLDDDDSNFLLIESKRVADWLFHLGHIKSHIAQNLHDHVLHQRNISETMCAMLMQASLVYHLKVYYLKVAR